MSAEVVSHSGRHKAACRCRACLMRARWQRGEFADHAETMRVLMRARAATPEGQAKLLAMQRRYHTNGWQHWQPRHDALLRDLAGTLLAEEIAARLTERFNVPRTAGAVHARAKHLGISLEPDWWSARALAHALGFSSVRSPSIVEKWARSGLLPAERLPGPVRSAWRIRPSDAEAFVSRHSDLLDWRRIRNPALKRLGEVADRADRWLWVAEAAGVLGVTVRHVRYLVARGRLVAVRTASPHGGPGLRVQTVSLGRMAA